MPASVPVGSATSCTATVTDAISGPAGDGMRTGRVTGVQTCALPFCCTLGSASTNPTTGAVSTSCAVSFTPNAVAIHTITASYSGDTTHAMSSGTTVVTALTHATDRKSNRLTSSHPSSSYAVFTAKETNAPQGSAIAPSRTVSFRNHRDPHSFPTRRSSDLSTNPTTGAVSTSCAVSFTPNAVAIHTITASYSGDTTHAMSSGTTVVTALTHATTTGVNCMPASVPVEIGRASCRERV